MYLPLVGRSSLEENTSISLARLTMLMIHYMNMNKLCAKGSDRK